MSSPTLPTSAALLLTYEELGGPVLENENFVIVTAVPQIWVPGNGDRVGLLIMNVDPANSVYIGIGPEAIGASVGILLQPQGGSISFNVRDDFTLPSRAWYMAAPGGNAIIFYMELSRFSDLPLPKR